MKAFSSDPNVERAHPNYLYYTERVPNDPSYGQQYGLPRVNAPDAWDVTTGSSSVKIAIIDSGVDIDHPDLDSKLVNGFDFVDINVNFYTSRGFTLYSGEDYTVRDSNPDDFRGHGTSVAGVAAAETNNGRGMAGMCWGCKIMPVRAGFAIRTPQGRQEGVLESDDIEAALIHAADNGADIINMSFGGNNGDQDLRDGIQYAYAQGAVLVAAAGNAGDDEVGFPARYTEVIAVGATDANDRRAAFSNFGDDLDVAAPGVNIRTTARGGSTTSISGTSFASPLVAGLVGLMLSEQPSLSRSTIRDRIFEYADKVGGYRYRSGRSDELGHGRINAADAVSPPLTAYVIGPPIVRSGQSNRWYVTPSGGTGTYRYQWFWRYRSSDPWYRASGENGRFFTWSFGHGGPGNLNAGVRVEIVSGTQRGLYSKNVIVLPDSDCGPIVNGEDVITNIPTCGPATQAVSASGLLPQEFSIKGNTPNPFRESTDIQYALPEAVEVELIVYDVLGREVARPLSGLKPAGFHRATFEAGSLPVGVYLYRFRAGNFVEKSRMVLMK